MKKEAVKSVNRIQYIDFLKCIGITAIILAHVGAPDWIMMLRSFDVPLMVILSALLGSRSFQRYKERKNGVWYYYIDRIHRLVIPTWIFLSLYFIICLFMDGKAYNLGYYLYSFGLTKYGIGYVWVILVYLFSALLIPLFDKIKLKKEAILLVFLVYLLYEVAYFFRLGMGNKLIDTTINTIIPYGFITFWGFNYFFLNRRNKKIILFSSLFIFILQGIYYWHIFGYPQQVQIAKYPPRLYYLGYGVSVSFALLIICEKINLRIWDNKGVFFISKNSLWIYLWHILCIYLYEYFNFPNIWYLKFGVVALTSVVLVFVMNKVIDYVDKEKHIRIFKYLKG